jgi:hypothetical protein
MSAGGAEADGLLMHVHWGLHALHALVCGDCIRVVKPAGLDMALNVGVGVGLGLGVWPDLPSSWSVARTARLAHVSGACRQCDKY